MARTGPKKAASGGFKIDPGRHFPPFHLRLIWLQKATGRQKNSPGCKSFPANQRRRFLMKHFG
jgi:hypothetical protein